MNKKKLLLFVDWFYPGYKAGGPIQSCRNIVALLKNDFDIYIVTSDRDLGDTAPYDSIKVNEWSLYDTGVHIFYSNAAYGTIKNMQCLIATVQPDTIYFNSMFSLSFTIKPLLAAKKMRTNSKIIVAPRGMLHQGAIKVKKIKKLFFLALIKQSGLLNRVVFHATDEQEVKDIQKYFPKQQISLVQNIPNKNSGQLNICRKVAGESKYIFISRIHPKKNIFYFIELLSGIKNHIIALDIYGYVDDPLYEQKCKSVIEGLPGNITVHFKEAIPNHIVFETISNYHVFVLPTLGENFGHAIFEAFGAGRPVLISDQTPWHNLEAQQIGWDIPLMVPKEFIRAIDEIAEWSQHDFANWCTNAYNFAQKFINHADLQQQYSRLFN